jgi:transcriptional regulator with XRE-family HTH domain
VELGGREPVQQIAQGADCTLTAIGNRVRELRQARRLTLQQAAKLAGLSPSMLSLVERGRASPSIGSLVVIANALGVTLSDLVSSGTGGPDQLVVRSADAAVVEGANHVISRRLRDDLARGVAVSINEYAPNTGNADQPISHSGFEYGFVLEGELTISVDNAEFKLRKGDFISYDSRRMHKMWNHTSKRVRTIWFNLGRDAPKRMPV